MKCELTNSFMFFIENPRTNIELVSGFFEFYFKTSPVDSTLGQVISKTLITYSNTDHKHHEFMPCILFTTGWYLQEILIYLPYQTFSFHKELKIHFMKCLPYRCAVCLEKKECVNLHKNQYFHCVCKPCLLRIDHCCPICRMDYFHHLES